MVATVSPSVRCYDATNGTLSIANRAKGVRNDTKRGEDSSGAILKELRLELATLDEQYSKALAKNVKVPVPEKITSLKDTISSLERARLTVQH